MKSLRRRIVVPAIGLSLLVLGTAACGTLTGAAVGAGSGAAILLLVVSAAIRSPELWRTVNVNGVVVDWLALRLSICHCDCRTRTVFSAAR